VNRLCASDLPAGRTRNGGNGRNGQTVRVLPSIPAKAAIPEHRRLRQVYAFRADLPAQQPRQRRQTCAPTQRSPSSDAWPAVTDSPGAGYEAAGRCQRPRKGIAHLGRNVQQHRGKAWRQVRIGKVASGATVMSAKSGGKRTRAVASAVLLISRGGDAFCLLHRRRRSSLLGFLNQGGADSGGELSAVEGLSEERGRAAHDLLERGAFSVAARKDDP